MVVDAVMAGPAAEHVEIVARAAIQIIVTCAAIDAVVTGATVQRICACAAEEPRVLGERAERRCVRPTSPSA